MLLLIVSSILFWRLGGAGFKWARRFVWPAIAGIILILSGAEHWRVLICVAGLIGVNHLGYGDRTTWRQRGIVLTLLAAPSLALSWHLWALRFVLMGGLASLFFWLSRRYNRFSHLLFETLCGFLQALTLVVGR